MPSSSFLASVMPSGSKARTVAPALRKAGTMARLGLSRMSSVFGLKVRPSTAMVLPWTVPPQARMTRAAIRSLRVSFTLTVVSTMVIGAPTSCAVRASARQSLGKHEPP